MALVCPVMRNDDGGGDDESRNIKKTLVFKGEISNVINDNFVSELYIMTNPTTPMKT